MKAAKEARKKLKEMERQERADLEARAGQHGGRMGRQQTSLHEEDVDESFSI